MKVEPNDVIAVAVGAETSRRRGWAMYYKAKKDNERLLAVNAVLWSATSGSQCS